MRAPLVLAALLAATAWAADPVLRIAVNTTTIESTPLFVANTLPEAAALIKLVPVTNGRAAMAQLVAGEVDVATGSETQLLLNSVAQPGLRAILTLAECRYRIVGESRKFPGAESFPATRDTPIHSRGSNRSAVGTFPESL